MSLKIAVTRAAANTDTGNQDFTTADLGGLTPKAAYFIITTAITDGALADHACFGIGACDGTNQWAINMTSEHGQANSDTDRRLETNECISIGNPGAKTVDGEASFVGFIANGVRINWDNAPAAAYLVTVILFAGTDLSVHCNTEALGDSVNNVVDVTNPGMQPDIVLAACVNSQSAGSSGSDSYFSVGVVKGGGNQRSHTIQSKNNAANMQTTADISTAYGVVITTQSSGALDWGGEFSDFDADGFTVTTRNNGANGTTLCYLALKFDGFSTYVGTYDTPTSIGDDAIATPSFTPQFLMFGMTHLEAVDTVDGSDLSGTFGLSVIDADNAYSNAVQDDDGNVTSDTSSLSDDQAVNFPDDIATASITGTFVSFDANGWTLNFSAVEGNAKKWWAFAVEEEAEEEDGVSITVPAAALEITGYAPTVTTTAHVSIEIPAGVLEIEGYAPVVTVSDHQSVEVPVGALELTGYAPTVTTTAHVSIEVPVGSLEVTGYAPTVTVTEHVFIEIPAGALEVEGYAPTVTATGAVNIEIPAGTLEIEGYAPTVTVTEHISIEVPVGTFELTGYAPTVTTTAHVSIEIPAGALEVEGYAPTVTIGGGVSISITVPVGALELTGYAPIVISSDGYIELTLWDRTTSITLRPRSMALTLDAASTALTLRSRSVELTLLKRN